MRNERTDKRKTTIGRELVEPHAESINIMLEQRESVSDNEKGKTVKNQQKLTIEELRSCKGFETISEAEGQEIIESLFQLAVIVYNF
jgi:hypothetical protein